MAALRKMTKTELLKRIETRRKQVATCRVQVASLNGQVLEGKKCQAQMAHMKSKSQGNNKVWLRKALKKCHGSEIGLHNKWVKCSRKSKMGLELCRRAGKVALTMEKNRCSRMQTRSALAKRAGKA